MNLNEYDYTLPPELIAQQPAEHRDRSRLMVLDLTTDGISHRRFSDLAELLSPGDILVLNDTRVFPARLHGRKTDTGAAVELFLLTPSPDGSWEALARPMKRIRKGTRIEFGGGRLVAEILETGDRGQVRARLVAEEEVNLLVDELGKTPLPPYIRHDPDGSDRERYQTVYARNRGAVAAPTAGLHFTPGLLERLKGRGIDVAMVTLHVGIGTFRPLTEDMAAGDRLHREYCRIGRDAVESISACRERGGRVIAVGTTTARVIESASRGGNIRPFEGWTDLFIKPPCDITSFDGLITNFHLPRSSLLVLVSAFAGRERIFDAYATAVRERYRFYSYGDAMLILKR